MKDLKLKEERYLIAVSGGPDSMALLNMVREQGLPIEVAHVNYHKRDTASRDEEIVRSYCQKYSIPFHVKDVCPEDVKGNFQAYARKVRYQYFRNLCKRYRLYAVLTAHQQDDLLETYVMQKERKLGVEWYGLKEDTTIEGVHVIRPLLQFTKKELLDYCNKKHIPYGIDESNLEDGYTRNRIRHFSIEKMTEKKREALLQEIERKNQKKLKEEEKISGYPKEASYTVKQFQKLPYLKAYLRTMFSHSSDIYLNEMIRQLCESDRCIFENNGSYLVKEYGKIEVFCLKDREYKYCFDDLKQMKGKRYTHFRLSGKGSSTEGVTLSEDDFPVIVRNVREGDSLKMRYGTKKINRFFIDRKIPLKQRLTWPVLCDKNGNVILVPGIGCDRMHYSEKHNIFMIKLEYYGGPCDDE